MMELTELRTQAGLQGLRQVHWPEPKTEQR